MFDLRFLYYAAIIFWMMTEFWIRIREGSSATNEKDQKSKIVIFLTVILAVILSNSIANLMLLPIIGNHTQHYLIATFLIIIGVVLRIWSVRTLGEFFRTTVMIQKKHSVISHGPYKYVRHPSYSAVLLATFGVGIGTGNLGMLLILFLIIFFGLRYRIFVEEKVLRRDLGKAYETYMQRSKMLIPFVY